MWRDKRVLVLEDEIHRQEWFKREFIKLDITDDPDVAASWLRERTYDFIFLDHDLGESYGYTAPVVTGMNLAKWLMANPTINSSARIIVHSMNEPAAKRMLQEMRNRRPFWCPFNVLMNMRKEKSMERLNESPCT